MDRRQFLASSGMAALAFAAEPVFAAGKASAGDTRLHGLLDAVFQDGIARSPEFATSLGVDKGKLAHLRGELSPATAAERHADLARNQNWLGKIKAVSDSGLSEAGKRHRALAIYQLEQRTIAAERFDVDSVQRPYPIFQQGGAYFSVPDFLTSQHPVESAADGEADVEIPMSSFQARARISVARWSGVASGCSQNRPQNGVSPTRPGMSQRGRVKASGKVSRAVAA
ncbi:MAG: hypothetical protein RL268_2211 [Pseudomonadota bacterium]